MTLNRAITEDFQAIQFSITPDSFSAREITKAVVGEISLKIFINGVEYASLLCINQLHEEMALGFLYNEGVIDSINDVASIEYNDSYYSVMIELKKEVSLNVGDSFRSVTSGCGKCYTYIKPTYRDIYKKNERDNTYSLLDIAHKMREFNEEPPIFIAFGGVHAAKFCNKEQALLIEDIGRHNCIDKISGMLLTKNISTSDGMLLISGRISSEIILKTIRMGVPLIVSRSTPTVPAIRIAEEYGITLLGYVRDGKGVIYAGKERVVLENLTPYK